MRGLSDVARSIEPTGTHKVGRRNGPHVLATLLLQLFAAKVGQDVMSNGQDVRLAPGKRTRSGGAVATEADYGSEGWGFDFLRAHLPNLLCSAGFRQIPGRRSIL